MKRLFTLTLLLLGISCAMMAQSYTGSEPKSGETYYLYNVGQNKFLSADSDGSLSLGGKPYLAVTLSQPASTGTSSSDASFFTLEANGEKIIAALYQKPVLGENKQGYYDQWLFSAVSEKKNVYRISARNREAGAGMHLFWSSIFNQLTTYQYIPAELFYNGQWMLVSEDQISSTTITLDETATAAEYSQQQQTDIANTATVKLKRTFTLNSWNSFCVPFNIDNAQLTSQFGTDVTLAEFTSLTSEYVNFSTKTEVEAGKPYLIKPTKAASSDDGYYEFTGVTELLETPTAQSQSYTESGTTYGVTFTGSFSKTTAPSRSFVLRQNKVYHLTSDMDMKGFRAYFTNTQGTSSSSASKVTGWTLDDTTDGITTVEDMGTMKFDVYNTAGQKISLQATSIDDLPAGVYIVNGKKITK